MIHLVLHSCLKSMKYLFIRSDFLKAMCAKSAEYNSQCAEDGGCNEKIFMHEKFFLLIFLTEEVLHPSLHQPVHNKFCGQQIFYLYNFSTDHR